MVLAVTTRDCLIFLAMGTALGLGVWLACTTRLWLLRAGALLSVGPIWVGLAYFGWEPFFGGAQTEGHYFGCAMLCLGTLSMALFGAIESVRKSLAAQATEGRGFPVEVTRDTR